MSRETGEILLKLLAKAIDGPAALSRAIAVATLDVAECLANCIDSGMASDIHVIKDSLLRKAKAEGDAAAADAQKRLAQATEAANRANLHKRNDAIARVERAQLEAAAAKTKAEADAIRSEAETHRLQAQAEAQARLIEAIAKLREQGGDIFFDREQLQKMVDAAPLQTLAEAVAQDSHEIDAKLSKYYGVTQAQGEVVFVALYPRAGSVQIGGDFNKWQPAADPMRRVGESGVWQAKMKLPPGRYHYRLVVDGQWQKDPYNDRSEPNPFGADDSIFEVK